MWRLGYAALAVILAILMIICFWPKSAQLPVGSSYTGYYFGFGFDDAWGLLGRTYYRIMVETDSSGRIEVYSPQPGFCRFRGFYDNGLLSAEGECLVELVGSPAYPLPDYHRVKYASYFTPDGTVGSQVIDGSGIETFWTANGEKFWECQVQNYERVRLTIWENGHSKEFLYIDGKEVPVGEGIDGRAEN